MSDFLIVSKRGWVVPQLFCGTSSERGNFEKKSLIKILVLKTFYRMGSGCVRVVTPK